MVTVHSVFRFLRTCNFCFKCIYVYTKRSSYFKVSCILYHIFIICKQKLFTTVLFPSCNNHFPCSLICIISRIARRLSSKSFPSSSMVISAYFSYRGTREFDSWISEKSTCRSHKTCFFCVKFLVFIYCILLQCVVKYNKGGILHASYYIEI